MDSDKFFVIAEYIVAIIVGVFFTRWVFKIEKINAHLRAQTHLLMKIAANTRQNIDGDYYGSLNRIIADNGITDDVPMFKEGIKD